MSFDFIARTYGRRFHRGQRVRALGRLGVVMTASLYVHVRLDGENRASAYRPTDVEPAETVEDGRVA
jgi:hypothetical protein